MRPVSSSGIPFALSQSSDPTPSMIMDARIRLFWRKTRESWDTMGCDKHMESKYEAPTQKLSVALPLRSAVMVYHVSTQTWLCI